MQLEKLIEFGFLGLTSGLLGFAVTFLSRISKSIAKLNEKVVVLIERTNWHGDAINGLDNRVTKLETERKVRR